MPVGGREHLAGHDEGMPAARAAGHGEALIQVPGRDIGQVLHRHVVERDIQVPPDPRRARALHAGQQRQRGGQAGQHVDHRQAGARGRGAGFPRQRAEPRFRLCQVVIGRPGGARAVAPIAGDVDADDGRLALRQRGVIQPKPRGQVAAQIVQHRIHAIHQPVQRRPAFGLADVQRDGALAAVEGLEILAVIRAELVVAGVAGDVARRFPILGRGGFDADHLRAEIGEVHRREGPRAELLESEDS